MGRRGLLDEKGTPLGVNSAQLYLSLSLMWAGPCWRLDTDGTDHPTAWAGSFCMEATWVGVLLRPPLPTGSKGLSS